jgi:hypothetical protein
MEDVASLRRAICALFHRAAEITRVIGDLPRMPDAAPCRENVVD